MRVGVFDSSVVLRAVPVYICACEVVRGCVCVRFESCRMR